MTTRPRIAPPFLPDQHRPIEACNLCGQPWPCRTEQDRVAAQALAREYVARAVEAAEFLKVIKRAKGNT